MKRCSFCKKIVWPWQKQYLGSTPAHAICDLLSFEDHLNECVRSGFIDKELAEKQILKRKTKAYC